MTLKPDAVAIDPAALVLHGRALEIYFEKKYPHVPLVEKMKIIGQSMTKTERKAAFDQAKILNEFSTAAMEGFRE